MIVVGIYIQIVSFYTKHTKSIDFLEKKLYTFLYEYHSSNYYRYSRYCRPHKDKLTMICVKIVFFVTTTL